MIVNNIKIQRATIGYNLISPDNNVITQFNTLEEAIEFSLGIIKYKFIKRKVIT